MTGAALSDPRVSKFRARLGTIYAALLCTLTVSTLLQVTMLNVATPACHLPGFTPGTGHAWTTPLMASSNSSFDLPMLPPETWQDPSALAAAIKASNLSTVGGSAAATVKHPTQLLFADMSGTQLSFLHLHSAGNLSSPRCNSQEHCLQRSTPHLYLHHHCPADAGIQAARHGVLVLCGALEAPFASIGILFDSVTPEIGARANAAYNGGGTRLVWKDAYGEGRWAASCLRCCFWFKLLGAASY